MASITEANLTACEFALPSCLLNLSSIEQVRHCSLSACLVSCSSYSLYTYLGDAGTAAETPPRRTGNLLRYSELAHSEHLQHQDVSARLREAELWYSHGGEVHMAFQVVRQQVRLVRRLSQFNKW